MATLAFSHISLTSLAICLRRSSERGGTARRRILPSDWGLSPTSLFWIAFSIALRAVGSKGLIMIRRGSGIVIEAIDFRGVGAP